MSAGPTTPFQVAKHKQRSSSWTKQMFHNHISPIVSSMGTIEVSMRHISSQLLNEGAKLRASIASLKALRDTPPEDVDWERAVKSASSKQSPRYSLAVAWSMVSGSREMESGTLAPWPIAD